MRAKRNAAQRIGPPPPSQLDLALVWDHPRSSTNAHTLSRPLQAHRSRRRIVRMVDFALRFFPELHETGLRIGIARGADGYASLEEPRIWLNPRGLCYQTISHELVHLLQARGLVPMGERSCDLFSLARDQVLVDAAPVYLRIPEAYLTPRGGLRPESPWAFYRTAREAIRRREEGERQYIRWFERALVERAKWIFPGSV